MSFSTDWLRMREPFDHRARADLASEFEASLLGAAPWRLLELGGGTGSGIRWLNPRMADAVEWSLLDHDSNLLMEVEGAHIIQGDVRDVTAWPDRLDGIQVQALLDLTDLDFLVKLADEVAARSIPILAALSVDGRVRWLPKHPDDEAIQAAFRVHQLGDRGFGTSVGPYAAPIFADLLRVRGFEVSVQPADWVIGPQDREMLEAMVESTAQAAQQIDPRGVDAALWARDRLDDIALGRLTLRVGHLDVLGCPERT
ncbi:MAG: hypothetical protein AAGA48_06060 [Myxococcota bacterium]